MSGSPQPDPLTWWEKREIQQRLASELITARELNRLAQSRASVAMHEATAGMVAPDSNHAVKRAVKEAQDALADYVRALENWKNFMIHGVVPPQPGDPK